MTDCEEQQFLPDNSAIKIRNKSMGTGRLEQADDFLHHPRHVCE